MHFGRLRGPTSGRKILPPLFASRLSLGKGLDRMHAILLTLGLVVAVAGVAAIGFGVPMRASSLGAALITAGAFAAVGGLILVALASVVRQLLRLAQALETWPLPRSVTSEAEAKLPAAVAGNAAVPWPEPQKQESALSGGGQEAPPVTMPVEDKRAARPLTERSSRAEAIVPAQSDAGRMQRPVPAVQSPGAKVIKSGVIEGMAYTLYSDGSIEADLPNGMMRFASLDELRAHLLKPA
jgi:hypothetical protein